MLPHPLSHQSHFGSGKMPFLSPTPASSVPDADRPMVQEVDSDRYAVPPMMIASGMMGFQCDIQKIIHRTKPAAANRQEWIGEHPATGTPRKASFRLQ